MSREIKFRAWDGVQMMYRTLFDRNWYNSDDKLVMEALPEDKHSMYAVMQYTGLKDKNGVEIFEGDILGRERRPLFDKPDGSMETAVVEYSRSHFGGRKHKDEELTTEVYYFLTCSRPYEVIGNIYENAELLKRNGEER